MPKLARRLLAVAALAGVVALVAILTLGALGRLEAGSTAGTAGDTTSSVNATRTLDALEETRAPSVIATGAPAMPVTEPGQRSATFDGLREFDLQAAMAYVRGLEAFGPRAGGSDAEAQAAAYIRDQLAAMGLQPRIEEFPLPDGTTSRNVVARVAGTSGRVIVLGAHYDSKLPSPGANDNGSGCGALLEIGALLAKRPAEATVELVFFGCEERVGTDPNAHHFGSRYRVSRMSAAERANCAGMISLDMIGYGTAFHSRTMGKGPLTLSGALLAHAVVMGVPMSYLRDTTSIGLSDHEPFERAGIPASCVTWRDDPVYHTAADVSAHLQPKRIQTAGALVLDFVRSLDAQKLESLVAR